MKDVKIVLVNHMDEVIPHAIISDKPVLEDLVVPDIPVDTEKTEKPIGLS